MPGAASAEVASRIRGDLRNGETFVLRGNVHHLAQSPFDRGEVDASLALPQITIHFKMSDAQQADLKALLEDQQDPSSPQYHHWLTPAEFGARFGIGQDDLDKVIAWLQGSGFTNVQVNQSRTAVSMSGTAALARSAFQAPIHRFEVNGVEHYANTTDPVLPRALTGMVTAIRGLNNFRHHARLIRRRSAAGAEPRFTSNLSGDHYLVPSDFATIYDVQPLYNAGINGSGQTIVIPGQSDISLSDIQAFRSASGLPTNNPTIVHTGTDPGVQSSTGDETESDLDVEWAGAIAPNASVVFVVAEDTFTAVYYAIDQNLGSVLSITYGDCESQFGQADIDASEQSFQQANAQGMTVVAAAGDDGAADCDDGSNPDGSTPAVASEGLAVDYPSSSTYVTGAGGSQFNDASGTYWSTTNNSQNGSALSYIPEQVWNTTTADDELAAGGGGSSILFTKPTWQQASNMPDDGARDTPDISFNASPDHDPYLICSGGDCTNGFRDSQSYLDTVGGTSASAPTFAAIVALLVQQTGSRQGNINPALYRLSYDSSDAFHDITSGNNIVPCKAGSPNCPGNHLMGYFAGAGYDRASGLGSLDAYHFVNEWTGAVSTPALTAVSGTLTQISVGADGTTWGVNGSQQVFRYNSSSQAWQQMPGSMAVVAVGSSSSIWALNLVGNIYRWNSSTSAWNYVPGNLSRIAVGADGDVWGLNSNGLIFHYSAAGWIYIPGTLAQIAVGYDGAVWGLNPSNTIFRFNPGTQTFEYVPGTLTSIAVGVDGEAWGINASNGVYHFNPLTQSWQQMLGTLSQISVGSANNVWGVDPSGAVYGWDAQTQRWNQVQGTLSAVSAGANGAVWGVNSAGKVYTYVHSTQAINTFQYIPGALSQVAVASDGEVWGLNSSQEIFTFNRLTQSWTWVPGTLRQISIARDGKVWGLNASNEIYKYNSSSQSWQQTPGWLLQVAVGDTGDAWGINGSNATFHYDAASGTWKNVPGALVQLSVGSDGAAWGVNSGGSVYRYDAASQSWVQMPGSFSTVAVGSSTNVWALNSSGQASQFNPQTQSWSQIGGTFSTISAAFDGTAWALTPGGNIYQFDSATQSWNLIPGALANIATGSDVLLWGLNSSEQIFQYQ